jgi:Sec-independent protein translocase protein TatA
MSGVGFSEIVILFMIGLIVLGPEKLPRVANQLGTCGASLRMSWISRKTSR